MPKKTEGKTIRITLLHSPIGDPTPQTATVKALGFTRLHQTVEHVDIESVRGMIAAVRHVVRVEE